MREPGAAPVCECVVWRRGNRCRPHNNILFLSALYGNVLNVLNVWMGVWGCGECGQGGVTFEQSDVLFMFMFNCNLQAAEQEK